MEPSLRPREQMRSDLIGFLLYAIAEDPVAFRVSCQKIKYGGIKCNARYVLLVAQFNAYDLNVGRETQLARRS